jgi:hypothetical protein
MSSTEHLDTYLNDHLAGANAGVEAAERLRGHLTDHPDVDVLEHLVEDIEHDRRQLRDVVERLGGARHGVKKAAGWLAGKTHHLALAEALTGSEDLTVLLEAETLALGIDGKSALWQTLLAVASAYPQLADIDLGGLAERARAQRERVEAIRLAAARRAFSTPG